MITRQSVTTMMAKMNALPLQAGMARVCCFGCGKSRIVPAGHEREALVRLQLHAQQHEPDLAGALRAAGTNDLVATLTWALPREDWHH